MGLNIENESVVGVDTGIMSVAINDLGDLKTAFFNWNDQLETLRDLVVKDWYGGASDQYVESYAKLTETMQQMIKLAENLQAMSQDTVDIYTAMDDSTKQAVYEALNII